MPLIKVCVCVYVFHSGYPSLWAYYVCTFGINLSISYYYYGINNDKWPNYILLIGLNVSFYLLTNQTFSLIAQPLPTNAKTLFLITITIKQLYARQPSPTHSLFSLLLVKTVSTVGCSCYSPPNLHAETLCLQLPIPSTLSCIHSTRLMTYLRVCVYICWFYSPKLLSLFEHLSLLGFVWQ